MACSNASDIAFLLANCLDFGIKWGAHENLDSDEDMNITLLRQKDAAEWNRCFDQLWTWAITAANRFLFRNAYSEQDRADVAAQVMKEFQQQLCAGKLPRCRNEDEVEGWIWLRTFSRARDLRRKREREEDFFYVEHDTPNRESAKRDAESKKEAGEAPVEPLPISDEARLDELIDWARRMPAGLSRNEEAAYRAIEIVGLTTNEHAAEIGRQPGTVGRWLWNAKLKLAAVLELELKMFL